jgi:hypothetical protein
VSATAAETEDDFGEPPKGTASRWKAEIEAHDKERERWRDRVERIEARYRDERNSEDTERRFALLWANLEVLQPTLYARDPKPEVARRFQDRDPVGRVMATIVERNLAVAIERGGGAFGRTMRGVVKDFLLGGQGVAWVRYEVEFGDDVDEGTGQPSVEDEGVCPDYVHWSDFGCTAGARVWDEVTAVWRRSFLDREELVERFGDDIGKRVPLDNTSPGRDENEDAGESTFAKATVYEIWDKDSRQTLWIHKGMDEPLDSKPYPEWMLADFPCPPPLFGTLTNGTLTPVPDYVQYQDQAQELDDLTGRIAALTSALRLAGFVPGDMAQEVQRALDLGGEAQVIPVKSWAAFGGQKLADLIVWLPIQETVATLTALQQLREKVKSDAYEITGLSDILRGSTQASETATAQQIKAQWGSIRVRTRQQDVQRFAAGLLERMAAAMVALFAPERLAEQANVQGMPPGDQQYVIPALQLLKGDAALTAYRVDVETDSTIEPDQQAEKASWTELLGGVAAFLGAFAPILQGIRQSAPQALPSWTAMGAELLLGAVRRFRAGPAMESSIEAAFEALGSAAAQAAQQQGPPPMSPVEMAQHQIEASKIQVAAQKVQVDAAKVQAEQQRTQAEMAHSMMGTALEHQRHATDTMGAHADRHVELARMQQDAQQRQAEMQQGDAHKQQEMQQRAQEAAQRPPPGANGSGG